MSLVTLYTRQGCHLCEEALRVIRDVARSPHVVAVVDIDADPLITDEYTIRVPVVEVDGQEIAQYQIDRHTLELALGSA